jgi:hypothetical protein
LRKLRHLPPAYGSAQGLSQLIQDDNGHTPTPSL